MATVALGDSFFAYVIGGTDPTSPDCVNGSTLIYSADRDSWTKVDPLPTHRSGL